MSQEALPPVPDSPLTRPLSPRLTGLAIVVIAVMVVALGRARHGSWRELGLASLAPLIFGTGLLCLWGVERNRGRSLPRPVALTLLVLLGAAAGGVAAVLAPAFGSVRTAVIGGLFWGTLMGVVWTKPYRR